MLAPEAETALPKLAKFTLARAEELESSEAGAVEGRLAEVSLATADSKEISDLDSVEGRVADAEIAKADSVTYTEGQAIVGKLAEAVIARADTKELATNEGISGKILETVITRADAKDIADVAPVEGRVADAALAHAKELEVEDSETALPKLAKFTLAKAEEKEIPAEHKPEVVIDDKSNIIPIIINPDDEPISAYLVTDAELIKTSAPEEEGPRQVVEKPEDAISVKAELPPEPTDEQIGEMLLTPPEYDEVDEIDFVPIDFAENEEPIELVKPIETATEEETPKAEAPAEEAPAEEAPAEPETFVIRANKPAYSIIETTTSDTPDGEHKEVETLVLKRSGYKIIEGGMKIEETPGRTIPGTEDKKYTLKEYEAPKTETAVADVEEITVVDEAPKASAMSIDDEINHPSETIEGAYRRSIPVRILHGKKESFGKGVIGQHIGFHTIADVKDDTVYIRDFAVAYNGVEGIHDINETQKASDERPIAIVDLTRYGNIRSIVIPKSELKDIDNIPGLTDLGFEMKAGRVTFDDESIKSIIHNCADEDIKITFHDGADLDAFGKPVKKALKSQNLVPLSAFSCEINESARDFARGKVKVTIPVEGVTSNDKLVVKYCLDRNTLTDDVFETPYIEREDDDLRKSGTPKVSCKLGHFSYFILTKDVSESAIGGKVVESEETKVVEKRVLDAAKSAGAYTITEDVREKAPKDEIVTVVDDAPKAEAPKAEALKAEEPKAEPVAEPGEVEAHQKEETADDITVEAPESDTAEKKPEVIEEPKAEEPKAEPEYSVLTSDYEGEGEKKERSDYGDTIIIKDTDEEAAEEAAPAEEVIEEAAPVEEASEESVAEEPVEKAAEPIKTITKGYILTETPEETKKIRGEGNYLVVEHEASALKIGGKASEEIETAPIKDAPVAEAKEEAYHEGEEIITVVDDEPVAEAPLHREVVSSEGKVIGGVAEEPKTEREIVIDSTATKVISERVLEAKKAKGAYKITEEIREVPKAEAPKAEDEILHVGEEIVTVVDDEPVKEERSTGAYVITEQPESAKRFDAKPTEEIKKEGYKISVDLAQAKKIEGRPELQYTITSDENGKKIVTSAPAEKTGAYQIEELSADTKVIEERAAEEAGEIVVLDEYTKTIDAREEAPKEHREVQEDDVTVIIEPVESEPIEKREVVADETAAKVVEAKTEESSIKGEILVLDAYTKIIRGKKTEEAPEEVVKTEPARVDDGEPQLMPVDFDGTIPEVIETAPVAEEISEPETAAAAPAVEEPDAKVIEPKKSSGYVITEKMRKPAPKQDDRRVVVEQDITPAPVPAIEPKEEALHVGEEVVTVVDDEPIAKAEKASGAYVITEQPDSAKRFEAKPKEEIKKGAYTLSVDLTQAKKIEGRPELQYTVSSDEKGKRVISAVPAEKTGAYEIEEAKEPKMVVAAPVQETYEAPVEETVEVPNDYAGEVIVLDDEEVVVAKETTEEPKALREVRTDADATKIIDARVLDTKKARGAYKIAEERRDIQWKPVKGEPQELLSEENGVIHSFDDVTVIAPKEEVVETAAAPVAEAPVAEVKEETLHVGEEIATIVADEPVAEAPLHREVVSSEGKVIGGVAEEPKTEREIVIDSTATKVISERVLEAKKAKGAYKITEEIREVPKAEAPKAEDEILHVGEEIVTVVEDEPVAEAPVHREVVSSDGKIIGGVAEEPKTEREIVIDSTATKVISERVLEAKKAKGAYKITEEIREVPKAEAPKAEDEILHVGEEIVTVVDDEPVAEAPVHREIVSSEGKVIEESPKTGGDYQIEEAPDSAKKFEAEKVEVKKGGYILSIDPTQAKKIEGREALASRVKSHDKSELVIASNGEEAPEVTEGYKIGQLDSDAKVISAKEETNGSIMVLDEYTKVVPERETAEEIVSVVEEPAEEPVAEPEKIYTGYILTEDSGKVKVISAKAKPEAEPAPVAEMKVSNLSIIDAPVYEGKETITILDDESVKDDFAKLTAISEFKSVASDKAPVSDTITVTVTESKPVITEHISTTKVIAASAPEEKAAEVVTPDAIDEPTVVVHDGGFVEEAAAAAPAAVKTVAELEGSAKVVEVGKILKAPKSRGAYVISESIGPAKVIGAKEEIFDTEGLDVVYDDDITILAAPKNDEPTVEPAPEKETYTEEPITTIEAEEPKAEPMPDEVVHKTRRRAGYIITEKYNEMKVINREEEPVSEPDLYGDADEELAIPTGIKILNSPKSRENYFLAESKNKLRKAESYEPDVTVEDEAEEFIVSGNKSGKFSIAERHDNKKKVQTVITDFDSPENSLVYEEIGSQRVVSSDRYKLPESPLVYEEIGSERIVSKDSYKLPEGPLVYEEIGSERMVQVEDGFESRVKDSIVEYKGTESIIRGDMPVVDVLIDPYQNNNMGVLTGRSLKRHLSATEKEINRLKYDLKYAKKKRDSFTKAAEKVVAHIAMINNQCLICEYYVERINVCTYSGADELAKRNASTLQGELKRYNDLITEYNEMTNSNIPHADKSITKRVLAGKPYEHLTRISYTFTGTDQAPLKAKKSFKGKVVQENRYLADIKLLNRRDEETANDLSLIDNRYKFETALLEGEKEIMEYKFAKNSIANDKRKAYINRKLKSLEREKAKAMKYEGMDNDRYYRVLLTDTNLASYSDNNSKKKRVNSIIYEMGDLLKKRDELNSKLNAIYSGPLGDIAGVGESDKWREVKVNAAKRHARKLRSKAHALKNSVPGFGDKKAKQVFTFNSLLDAKVEALATIDLCKYRLKKEKNNLFNKAQIKKDMREARRTVKLINREIKDRKKMILDDHYGPDASNDFIAIIALAIIAVIGGIAFAHFYTDIDVLGILGKLKSMVGPLIQRVIEIVKTYLG